MAVALAAWGHIESRAQFSDQEDNGACFNNISLIVNDSSSLGELYSSWLGELYSSSLGELYSLLDETGTLNLC